MVASLPKIGISQNTKCDNLVSFPKSVHKYNLPIIITDIRCNNLSTPTNGEIMSCSSRVLGVGYEGDTCSFTCNTGYELTGSDTRTCQSDESWSGSDDLCRRGMFYDIMVH